MSTLEGGECICEAKWHHNKLILPFICPKSHFYNVILVYSNLIITGVNTIVRRIGLHEDYRSPESDIDP